MPSAQETISGGAKEADGLAQQVEEGQESRQATSEPPHGEHVRNKHQEGLRANFHSFNLTLCRCLYLQSLKITIILLFYNSVPKAACIPSCEFKTNINEAKSDTFSCKLFSNFPCFFCFFVC